MSYYKVLGLETEPFSTSPDPNFFYLSQSHNTALKRLEINLRLRRGLSLILGDIGTGKTTLSRTLLQTFQNEDDFIFHIILDPGFESPCEFLLNLAKIFDLPSQFKTVSEFKGALKKYLFQTGVEENKTVVLIIDEGQKISGENLEVLRTLLNYETNEYKLIQLVIMAQIEFIPIVTKIRNFMDRVALKYTINPLDEDEIKEMVEFRLKQAGYNKHPFKLFTDGALKLIYEQTQGYPRRIAMLCHEALKAIVMKDKAMVDEEIIRGLIGKELINERK
jgi:general secretion pathway protein A